ncbi:hypothetical protein ACHAQA_007096 [Verticillium albo-atrum]
MSGHACTNWTDMVEDDVESRPRVKLPPANPIPAPTTAKATAPVAPTLSATSAPAAPAEPVKPSPAGPSQPDKLATPAMTNYRSNFEPCAVFAKGTDGPVIACNPAMSDMCKISATFVASRYRDATP